MWWWCNFGLRRKKVRHLGSTQLSDLTNGIVEGYNDEPLKPCPDEKGLRRQHLRPE